VELSVLPRPRSWFRGRVPRGRERKGKERAAEGKEGRKRERKGRARRGGRGIASINEGG